MQRKGYPQFLAKFSSYNDFVKMRIVKAHFIGKFFLLLELVILKLLFMVAAFPFFLYTGFSGTGIASNKDLQSVTASPQRSQQVLVLSIVSVVALVIGFNSLFASLISQKSPLRGTATAPIQFTGSRVLQDNIALSVDSISVSPYDHTVQFEGTGPSYAHVALFVDNGESFVASSKVNGQGNWQFSQNADFSTLAPGTHSVFAVFYGDDGAVLGQPSPMKMFTVGSDTFSLVFRYFGVNALLMVVLALGVLGFSVVKLKKTATA